MTEPKKLFIIDAMALAFRTFYALGQAGLTSATGNPVSCIYGTALFLHKLLREESPDYLVVMTDTGDPTWRHHMYPQYKAHRDKMPDDLKVQLEGFWSLFEAFKIPVVRQPGVEADDLIGSAVKTFQDPRNLEGQNTDLKIYIVSGDKDFQQILAPRVFLYAPKKNQAPQITGEDEFVQKFGFAPERFIDCLALMGDSADNIPGIKGIGEKGALKLLAEYGSLDAIYEHVATIKSESLRKKIIEQRDAAFLSRILATIKTDIPINLNLSDMAVDYASIEGGNIQKSLLDFYEKYKFKALLERSLGGISAAAKPSSGDALTLADGKGEGNTKFVPLDFALIPALNTALSDAKPIFIALADSNFDPIIDPLGTVRIHISETHNFTVDCKNPWQRQWFASILSKKATIVVGVDLKPFFQMLKTSRIEFLATAHDLVVMDYLCDPNQNKRDLESIKSRFLPQIPDPIRVDTPSDWPPLYQALSATIVQNNLSKVASLEASLIPVLAIMEQRGIFVDADILADFSLELSQEEAGLRSTIFELAGETFNIQSPKQLQTIIFDKLKIHELLGIRKLKRTKTGFSTDEDVLQSLCQHPLPQALLKFREVAKLRSTYVDTLPQHIHPKTGRIHAKFNQTVAATGRLSSDRPNLQNIPMRTERGKRIRRAFRPQYSDHVFISADYSQIEIRLLAAFAKAEPLIASFKNGLDVHTATAAKVFAKTEAEVTPELRSRAKAVNFGIMYGMGPNRLASQTGVSLKEAKDFIYRYFDAFPEIATYLETLKKSAKVNGYSETILGRRRAVEGLADSNGQVVARAENIAVNSPIQGSAADLIKIAMVNVENAIKSSNFKAKMLLQVHDELVFEVPVSEVAQVTELIRNQMEGALELSVPLKVDIRHGHDWLEAH